MSNGKLPLILPKRSPLLSTVGGSSEMYTFGMRMMVVVVQES